MNLYLQKEVNNNEEEVMECGCNLEESYDKHKQVTTTEEDRWDIFADAVNTVNDKMSKK